MDTRTSRAQQFLALEYVEAARLLHAVQPEDVAYRGRRVSEEVPSLRENILKPSRESRLAAIFAFGMGQTRFGADVSVAVPRCDDYDFVVSWPDGKSTLYVPFILRELTLSDSEPRTALAATLDALETCEASPDLHAAVFVNRRGRFEYGPWLQRAGLPLHGVWLFGRLDAAATEWFTYGDLRRHPDLRTFRYPR